MYEAANDSIYDTKPTQYSSLAGGAVHGTAATRGHLAGNGGLRGHSVGGPFPCVLFAKGNCHITGGLSYWFKSPDSQDHGPYATWDESELAAFTWLHVNRPVSFEPQVEV